MTPQSDLDRRLTSWLVEDAPRHEPDGLLERTLDQLELVHPQPGWLAAVRGTSMGRRADPVPRLVVVLTLIGLLTLLAIGTALIGSGGPRWIAVAPSEPVPTSTIRAASVRLSLPPVTGLPGRFAFVSPRDGDYDIYAMNPDRTDLAQLTDDPGADVSPIWSPTGSRIAFSSTRNGDADVFVMNPDGSDVTRVTKAAGDELLGAWSPVGTHLAYTDALGAVHVVAADGSGDRTIEVDTGPGPTYAIGIYGWTPGGDALLTAFDKSGEGGQTDIYRLRIADGRVTALTTTSGDDGTPALSPDGSTIAFESDRDGGCLFVMDADGSNVRRLTSGCSKGFPKTWAPDGSRIAWASGTRTDADQPKEIQVIDVDGGNRVQLTDSRDVVDLTWGPSAP